ncbi:MAG: isopentenyl-diphosphate delta-isomerase [Pseudomonadota bacterium]
MASTDMNSKYANAIVIPGIADDGSYYPIEKMEAHRAPILHLAVSVFVFDVTSGDLLIQQRASDKYHCGGLWANTCCTHPNWGEPLAASASRRLREELGISVILNERRVFEYSADCGNGLHEHERVTFYAGYANKSDLDIPFNAEEVANVRWVHPTKLQEELSADPNRFAPWFQIYLRTFPDLKV